MKKTLILIVCITALSNAVHAQKVKTKTQNAEPSPSSYLGLGTGINNISGFAGLTFEQPFSPTFTGKLGLGIGAWGFKVGLAGKYYKNFPESWSFGAGYSTASGLKSGDLEVDLKTTRSGSNTEKVKMVLDRAHMLDLVIGKAWGDKVKFNLDFGYSIPIAGGTYAPVDKTVVLASESVQAMNLLSPSGLILGMGIAFRL